MSRRHPLTAAFAVVFLLVTLGAAQEPVRVATWNLQAIGTIFSSEWNDEVSTLDRMCADVVVVQEIDNTSEVSLFPTFAAAAGYSNSAVSSISGTLSGSLYNGVMSSFPIVFSTSHSAADLSGDPGANDITRDIFEVHVQVPNASDVLGLFIVHLKAGSGGTNDFRRAIEAIRLKRAVDDFLLAHPSASYMICGDFNEDLGDNPFDVFFSLPGGLPQTYQLGSDITFPVTYDPFTLLTSAGGAIAPATQEDSTTLDATRQSSGRRLDYVIFGNGAVLNGDEVYNSARDNGVDDAPIGNFLPKCNFPLASGVSNGASDHFPVFGDFEVPTASVILYPGSGEDFVMSTGVNGAPTTGPGQDVKFATAGDVLTIHYVSPGGTFDLEPPIVVGEIFPAPGVPPTGPLAGMWFSTTGLFIIFNAFDHPGPFIPGVNPGVGNTHTFVVAGGFGGLQIMLQSLVVSSLAANGFVAFADAHELDLVP